MPDDQNNQIAESSDDVSSLTEDNKGVAQSVNRWAIHRRMYDWMISFAHHRHASLALFGFSFAESSFFPIPPDVLLGPMCLGHRKKSFWFAFVCSFASVLGAFLGYWIGLQAIEIAIQWIPGITESRVDKLATEFEKRGEMYVFIAAVTPIPFKLLTITAGASKMSLPIFLAACVVGRSFRFFAVAGVFYVIGPKAVPFIDKYFNWLCIAFIILLVGGVYIAKLLS